MVHPNTHCPNCNRRCRSRVIQCAICQQRYHRGCYDRNVAVPENQRFVCYLCNPPRGGRWPEATTTATTAAEAATTTTGAASPSTPRASSSATTVEGESRAQQAATAAASTPEVFTPEGFSIDAPPSPSHRR